MRRTMLAAAVAVLALTTAACDGFTAGPEEAEAGAAEAAVAATTPAPTTAAPKADAADQAARAVLRAAAEKTRAAGSAKLTGNVESSGLSSTFTGALSWTGGLHGEVDVDNRSGLLGQDYLPDPPPFTARFTPDAMYGRYGDTLAAQNQGRRWVRFGYGDLARVARDSGKAMLPYRVSTLDPATVLDTALGASSIGDLGDFTVNGVPTRYYTVALSVDDLAEVAGRGQSGDQVEALRREFRAGPLLPENLGLWIGRDGLLVKMDGGIHTAGGAYATAVVYSDYGTAPAPVQTPAADDTVDLGRVVGLPNIGTAP